jgi:hypothetical protein
VGNGAIALVAISGRGERVRPYEADPSANFFDWRLHVRDLADIILISHDNAETKIGLVQTEVELTTSKDFPMPAKGIEPLTYPVIIGVERISIIPNVAERYVTFDPLVEVTTGRDIHVTDRPFIWMNEYSLHLTLIHLHLAECRSLPLN